MVFCAVVGCNNNNNKSSKDYNVECRYFSFPNSKSICVKWVHKCYQQHKFNVNTARICSKHFVDSDFSVKEKLLRLPFTKWKLKPDAVPSVNLTTQKDLPTESQRLNRLNRRHLMQNIHVGHVPQIQEQDSPAAVETKEITVSESNTSCVSTQTDECSQDKIATLEQEVSRLKTIIQKQEAELRQVEKVFTKGQLRQLKSGQQVKWTADDIASALSVYAGGARSYRLLRKRGFPLPGVSTLRRWAGKINVQPGYYQPAGPLINVPPHGHAQPSSLGKPAPLSEVSSSPTPPLSHQTHSQSSAADSLDSDVIITSATNVKEPLQPQQPPPTYRYSQYPAPHPGYSYGYPPQYYPAPPAPSYHHELCYPPSPYLHHKAFPPAYRRLAPPTGSQYYPASPPELYHPSSVPNQQSQQVVTATPAVSTAYQPPPSGGPPLIEGYPPPPPPTLVEPYPTPAHYYPGYGPAPPPSCYTHSPPTRTLPYINAAYQSCPCPMQSCPKNVHTGPLTGDSKRSHISSIAKDSLPLPPVALALPLEPVSATGPPSPARGSAGMPPPPSPAGATYQPPPPTPKQEGAEGDCKPIEKKRKARVGKNMVRNNIAANFPENTMLLMCHPPQHNIKREIESPEEQKLSPVETKKTDTPEIAPLRTSSSSEVVNEPSEPQKDVKVCLKSEENEKDELSEPIEKEPSGKTGELLPCVKTVAENVKMKNMKRKLSITKEDKLESELISPPKKQNIHTKLNGSYKDLIKKHVPSIKINNGKRKLNIEAEKADKSTKLKKTVKRKLSPSKEEPVNKRLKTSKPLAASNLHNSKQNLRNTKSKCFDGLELSENKEPLARALKKYQVNSKTVNGKKLAPAILDSLFAKNNVDRTIDSVVTRYADTLRTNKKESSAKSAEKCKSAKTDKEAVIKSTNSKTGNAKPKVVVTKKVGACKRKMKSKSVDVLPATISRVPRKSIQTPRWSNGWTWKGEPFQAKVFLNSDETTVIRKCYPAMKHTEGDIIEPKDCVLLKAGPRRNDLPFVAKVAALWENPDDGEMMMSLLWYYRPEHTEQGRQPYDEPDEVFASRHKDTNSVACIEDKCYVLTFNEYCRYRKSLRRLEEGLENAGSCISNPEPYPRLRRQPPSAAQTPSDLVFFCRRVYDFRQKRIVKNPS